MSDSKVESLLKQMSLKAPSSDLQSRIENAVQKVELAETGQPSAIGGRLIYTVAAICLLIGVAVGRMTSPKQMVEFSPQFTESARQNWTPVEGSTATAIPVSFNGPQVAVFCSAKPDDVPAHEEDRCSKCHMGATGEKPAAEFNEEMSHVHQVHRQLCAKCHVGLDDWMPHQIDSAIFGVPYNPHTLPEGKEAPTG